MAQLGEHRLRKAGVGGSNPLFSTNYIKHLRAIRECFFFWAHILGHIFDVGQCFDDGSFLFVHDELVMLQNHVR